MRWRLQQRRCTEGSTKFSEKVYNVKNMNEFRKLKEKGKSVEQVKQEKVAIFSIYQQEDELSEAMNKFKHNQEGFNRDPRQ